MIKSWFLAFASAAPLALASVQAVPPNIDHGATMRTHGARIDKGSDRHAPQAAKHPKRPMPLSRVAAANRAAVRQPQSAFYVGAAQVYPWSEGALYQLYAAPEQISDIALQPGENLVSVAAGDTARWIIGDTTSGSGASRRNHILVKPAAPGLRTNLVIATDRRIYHVEAASLLRTAMASISWTYPEESMAIVKPSVPLTLAPIVEPALAVEDLNFGYRLEGDDTSWRPLRAFDDGHQTFIEFPPTLGDGQAPPLFVIGAGGKPELVNYRQKGHYYIVDGIFAAAELRLGEKHQQVVRIIRESAASGPRRTA